MSKPTERADETGRSLISTGEGTALVDVALRFYHVPVLGLLMALMLWIRLQSYDNFVIGGQAFFTGNDPWYHFRETSYVVENWPNTMPYDPWTGFPTGRLAGQFGTLWDQMVATAILIVGLGDPTQAQADAVMLVATPVMAVLVVIPAYYLARRFMGRGPAVFSILLLALVPGQFLTRSTVGSYQHHAAETFFMTLAVLAFAVAFAIAEKDQPIWELVLDRDFDALKRPLFYSLAAGFSLALYLFVWQPGVLLVGILGIFFVIKLTADVVHGDTPEPIAFVGAVGMTFAGLLLVIPLEEPGFGVTAYSYTQIVLPIGVALGCVLLAFLARQWERRDLEPTTYPVAVGGLMLATIGVMMVALPDLWSTLYGNFVRFVGFGASDTARTIAEAQALLAQGEGVEPIVSEFGLLFFFAAAAFIGLIVAPLVRSDDYEHTIYAGVGVAILALFVALPALPEAIFGLVMDNWQIAPLVLAGLFFAGATFLVRYDTENLLLLVWTGFLIAATFTQLRFSYYLVIPVVILSALVVAKTFEYTNLTLDTTGSIRDAIKSVEGWQVMIVSVVLLAILLPGLVVPVEAAGAPATAWQIGEDRQPGAVVAWDDTFEWMQEDTPYPGELEGHDNAMEYYGTYEYTDDFDYPPGAYGVMSWWDYGHWITTQGERIPHANPFQQNAREAANFLLAPDEDQAEDVVDRLSDPDAETRYVMVDWQMVSLTSKFGAPVVWYDDADLTQEDFYSLSYFEAEEGFQPGYLVRNQRYYESQMVQLYEFHGSAVDPNPIVVTQQQREVETRDGDTITIDVVPQGEEPGIEEFDTMEEAEAFVEENPGAQIGGVGPNPEERVEALEHYRLVKSAETTAQFSNRDLQEQQQLMEQAGISEEYMLQTSPQWVKTFERVPGATIEGDGAPPGAEVRAQVAMRDNATDTQFPYVQYAEADEDGQFEFTVPYSTTGYDEFGPDEGYTDVDVVAESEYQITAIDTDDGGNATGQLVASTDVEEAAVIGVDEEPIEVELEPFEIDIGPDEDEEADEEGTDDEGADGESDGDDTTDATIAPEEAGLPSIARTVG